VIADTPPDDLVEPHGKRYRRSSAAENRTGHLGDPGITLWSKRAEKG